MFLFNKGFPEILPEILNRERENQSSITDGMVALSHSERRNWAYIPSLPGLDQGFEFQLRLFCHSTHFTWSIFFYFCELEQLLEKILKKRR